VRRVMDGRGTEVTPEGYLYTGSGELMFLAGPMLTPVEQRIRTLRGGWLPVVECDIHRGDVAYHFTLFAATLDGLPESPVVDFVRVTMTNAGGAATRARLAFAVRYTGPSTTGNGVGDNRFRRPYTATRPRSSVPSGSPWTSDPTPPRRSPWTRASGGRRRRWSSTCLGSWTRARPPPTTGLPRSPTA